MSYRRKVILIMIMLQLSVLSAISYITYIKVQDEIIAKWVVQQTQIDNVLVSLVAGHFLDEDLDFLQNAAEEMLKIDNVVYVGFYSAGGNRLVSSQSADIELNNIAEAAFRVDTGNYDDRYYKITKEIHYENQWVGDLVSVVSIPQIRSRTAVFIEIFLPFALLGVFGVILVNYFFIRFVYRNIEMFGEYAGKISQGQFGLQIPEQNDSEMNKTISFFNDMSVRVGELYLTIEEDKQRLEKVFNTVVDGIATINHEGIIQSINNGVTEIFGYEESELVGHNISMLMPSPYRDEHDGYLRKYLAGGAAHIIGKRRELSGLKKNGDEFPLELAVTQAEMSGETIFVGVMRSLEDIKLISDELSKVKELNDKVLETAFDAIVIVSSTGEIVYNNPAASSLFGFEGDAIKGQKFADLVVFDEQVLNELPIASSQANPERSIEMVALTRYQGHVPVEVTMVSIKIGDEFFINTFIKDIRARRDIHKQILDSKKAAESASRAKSEFLAVMSHEIRTPMNVILGALSILEETNLTNYQKRYFDIARESGKTLLWLINDILDFSKIEAGKLEIDHSEFELVPVVEETIGMLVSRAEEKNIELVYSFDCDLPQMIIGDSGKIRQVLINLIGNAIKFTESGGVYVKCVRHGEDNIAFYVIDTGLGIPRDKLPDMFERFNQVDGTNTRRYGGTGLGLAISRSLSNLMGGDLTVWSEMEIGSQFCFIVPHNQQIQNVPRLSAFFADITLEKDLSVLLYSDCPVLSASLVHQLSQLHVDCQIKPAVKSHAVIEISHAGSKRRYHLQNMNNSKLKSINNDEMRLERPLSLNVIRSLVLNRVGDKSVGFLEKRDINRDKFRGLRLLLAEDSEANQLIAKTMLENAGYVVDVVSNGQEAVDAVKNFTYALVLMDVSMPVMDGITATRLIKDLPGELSRTIVIAMTANVFKDDIDRCYESGMQGFVAKPIDKKRLLEGIQKALVNVFDDNEVADPGPLQSQSGTCLNTDTLDELINDIGMDVVPQMLDIYMQETHERNEHIKDALISHDYDVIRSEAHAIKSSSGSVGLVALQQHAYAVESACRQEEFEKAHDLAGQLPAIVRGCLNELESFVSKMADKPD